MKKIEKRIEKLENKYIKEVEKIAETVRKEIVFPLCKKHQYTFYSGMGIYSFYNEKGRPIMGWEEEFKNVYKAEEILSISIFGGVSSLGEWVKDVKKEEIENGNDM